MIAPQPGQQVIIFFRNGIQLDGEVIEWSDGKSILKSPRGTSIIVIQKTLDDVVFYKIHNAHADYEALAAKTIKTEDDIKSVAKLKNELNQLERSEIRDKLNEHRIGDTRQVNYGFPNIKIKSSIKRPREETPRASSDADTELQNMFAKKH